MNIFDSLILSSAGSNLWLSPVVISFGIELSTLEFLFVILYNFSLFSILSLWWDMINIASFNYLSMLSLNFFEALLIAALKSICQGLQLGPPKEVSTACFKKKCRKRKKEKKRKKKNSVWVTLSHFFACLVISFLTLHFR